MPIRFRCPGCQQRLSIGSHKSGAQIQCPTCKEMVRVPESSEVSVAKEASSSERELENATPSPSAAILTAEPVAPAKPFPVAAEVMESRPSPASAPSPVAWLSKLDQSRVAVPRYVIFSQGLLLGAVGLVCLVVGICLGWSFSPTTSPIDPETMPCVVKGVVEYEDSRGERHPDIGAVILALPAAKPPEKSISSEGLGPDDPQPKAEHPGLRELESLGGRIARTNAAGRYEFRVPRGGDFYIVAISKQARRGGKPHQPKAISTIGKYIAPATRLLGDYQYSMQEPVLREERDVDFFFKPSTAD